MKRILPILIIALSTLAAKEASAPQTLQLLEIKDGKITGPKEDLQKLLKVRFISASTDQPEYWPHEKVVLKVLRPAYPNSEISAVLQRKGSGAEPEKKFRLDSSGILAETVLDGSKKKLALGEYEIRIKAGEEEETAKFTVVEGTLGGLSFAKEFKALSSQDKKEPAYWIVVNEQSGSRWGNFLKFKNEVRFDNAPLSGTVTLKTRCYLPGCNGVEAGPHKVVTIKEGVLEGALDVSSHSGPFELEIITGKGSLRHLFEGSGHVEREMAVISHGLKNVFRAGLAPYENTEEVPGRSIFIEKDKETADSPVSLRTPIGDEKDMVFLDVQKPVRGLKVFLYEAKADGSFASREFPAPEKIEKGSLEIPAKMPYTLIVLGGFEDKKSFEGYSFAFPRTSIEVEITAPESGAPLSEQVIQIKTSLGRKPVSVPGILEVFDNRVASKDPSRPLTSHLGDSFRDASNSLENRLYRPEYDYEEAPSLEAVPSPAPSYSMMGAMPSKAMYDMSGGGRYMAKMAPPKPAGPGGRPASGKLEMPDEERNPEPLRLGIQKVLYAGLVVPDARGLAKVALKLGPQTGRYRVRYVAVKGYDVTAKEGVLDSSKKAFVEAHFLPLLLKGSRIQTAVRVHNQTSEKLRLLISGTALEKAKEAEAGPGEHEIPLELEGGRPGTLIFELKSGKKTLDRRQFEVKDLTRQPVTLSQILVSDGSKIPLLPGQRASVYSQAGQLLEGLTSNIFTTLQSWFDHSEALSAKIAVQAVVLKAVEEKIIAEEGMRQRLIFGIQNDFKDLKNYFYDSKEKMFLPYPKIEAKPLWSAWAAKNLSIAIRALKDTELAKAELSQTLAEAKELRDAVNKTLIEKKIELADYDPENPDKDTVLVPTADGVKSLPVTDTAVIDYVSQKILRIPGIKAEDLAEKFGELARESGEERYWKAVERSGSLPVLIQMAKGLWLSGEKAKFQILFNRIAKGVIQSQEPGLIQGPSLLGGIHDTPASALRFLELLSLMKDSKAQPGSVAFERSGKIEHFSLSEKPVHLKPSEESASLQCPAFSIIRLDIEETLNLEDYAGPSPFFTVELPKAELKMGEEGLLQINLKEGLDPYEYYAIVGLPSNTALRQTEDILLDYKGNPLYGQRSQGAQKIQLATVPFRALKTMTLILEGAQTGESPAFVLVRHMHDPDQIAALWTNKVAVNPQ